MAGRTKAGATVAESVSPSMAQVAMIERRLAELERRLDGHGETVTVTLARPLRAWALGAGPVLGKVSMGTAFVASQQVGLLQSDDLAALWRIVHECQAAGSPTVAVSLNALIDSSCLARLREAGCIE